MVLINGSSEQVLGCDDLEDNCCDDEYEGVELVRGGEGERVICIIEKLLLTIRDVLNFL